VNAVPAPMRLTKVRQLKKMESTIAVKYAQQENVPTNMVIAVTVNAPVNNLSLKKNNFFDHWKKLLNRADTPAHNAGGVRRPMCFYVSKHGQI